MVDISVLRIDEMYSILIILASIIVLGISAYLFHRACGSISISRFNTVSFVFYFSIIFSTFIGSILVALGLADWHYMLIDVQRSTKIEAWAWVCYSMIMMPLSMILLNHALNVRVRKRFFDYINADINYNYGPKFRLTILIIFLIISVSTLAYILIESSSIPLLTAIVDRNLTAASIERNITKRSFGGIIYIKNLLGLYLIPIFSYYAYIIYHYKRGLLKRIIFYSLTFISVLLLTYDIQKGPIVLYVLGFIIIRVLIVGKIPIRKFGKFVLISFVLVLLAYSITTDKNFWGLFYYKSAFFSRAFISGYGGLPLSLEWFPDIITKPTWYIGMPQFILDIFNVKPVESARLVMQHLDPEGVKKGTAGVVSSYFLAEAWANYGLTGLLLSPIIVGLVVQSVHLFLLTHKKDPLIIAFYAHISTHWLVQNGFVNFLYLKQLLFPLFLFLFLKLLIMFLKQYRDEKKNIIN